MGQWHTSEKSLVFSLYASILSKRDTFWMRGIQTARDHKEIQAQGWKRLNWSGPLTLGNCAIGGSLLDAWETQTLFTCESFIWMPATQAVLMAKGQQEPRKTRDTCFVHLSFLCTWQWGSRTERLVGRRRRERACLQSNFLALQPDWTDPH